MFPATTTRCFVIKPPQKAWRSIGEPNSFVETLQNGSSMIKHRRLNEFKTQDTGCLWLDDLQLWTPGVAFWTLQPDPPRTTFLHLWFHHAEPASHKGKKIFYQDFSQNFYSAAAVKAELEKVQNVVTAVPQIGGAWCLVLAK